MDKQFVVKGFNPATGSVTVVTVRCASPEAACRQAQSVGLRFVTIVTGGSPPAADPLAPPSK